MTNLTTLEIQVLKAFPTNYTCAEDEISDNCTSTDVKELSKITGLEVDSVKGVIGSLVKKGLVDTYTIHKVNDSVVLSDLGIEYYYN